MAEPDTTAAWIALFLGLYSLAAAMGEFRAPGTWVRMLKEFERSTALRFVTGLLCIALGAAIYLVTPWNRADWLSLSVSVIGGLCAAEGMLILAAGDRFLRLARAMMVRTNALWAGFAALFGMGAIVAAMARLQHLS